MPSRPGSGPGSLPGHQEHESINDSSSSSPQSPDSNSQPYPTAPLVPGEETAQKGGVTHSGPHRRQAVKPDSNYVPNTLSSLNSTTLRGRMETSLRRRSTGEGAAGPLPKSRTTGSQPQGCTASAWCSRSRQGSPSSDPPTSWPRQEGGRPSPGLCC